MYARKLMAGHLNLLHELLLLPHPFNSLFLPEQHG